MSDHYRDWVAAYSLGALDQHEAVELQDHLVDCPDCRHELSVMIATTNSLSAAVSAVEPTPELKQRLMNVVRSEAKLLRSLDRVVEDAPVRRWRPSLKLVLPLASVIIMVVIGTVVLRNAPHPDVRTVAAASAPAGSEVRLRVRGDDHSTITVAGLRSPGRGRVYQVWILDGDRARPTEALFEPNGVGRASVDVPERLRPGTSVLVTSEPDGGSQTPSRVPVIAIEI